MTTAPTLTEIEAASEQLAGRIVATPTLTLNSDRLRSALPDDASVVMKMELFQQAGSFKSRGVLLAIDAMDDAARAAGVTAVSAGNHALAVSWGAQAAALSAKVVMPKTADPVRVEGCKALGAEVLLCENVGDAFKEMQRLVDEEGRTMLHPFESPYMTLGAATCGLELARSVAHLDIAIIPVGGGGLISGMAHAIKLIHPNCEIIGVEPLGADSMFRSFEKGEAVHLDGVNTMADSLGAPMAMPETFALTKANVARIERLEESAFPPAMRLLYDSLKIVAEPACAASFAALMGPLRGALEGKSVAIIACGSNIGLEKYARLSELGV
ncbi:threonine/serine dehydratase [Pseudahrensia aquimaris]|uniref:Threonine/serine dehydratase n=1 Tax=Pseudahrensia aquimaris TaxID=744461 RepID=A0ABW3FFU3_9HYPH